MQVSGFFWNFEGLYKRLDEFEVNVPIKEVCVKFANEEMVERLWSLDGLMLEYMILSLFTFCSGNLKFVTDTKPPLLFCGRFFMIGIEIFIKFC